MSTGRRPQSEDARSESPDRSALLLMLAYVEAECRRIGALEAARHAAMAASLMPQTVVVASTAAVPGPPPGAQLH